MADIMIWGEENPIGDVQPHSWQEFTKQGGGSLVVIGDSDWGTLTINSEETYLGPVEHITEEIVMKKISLCTNQYDEVTGEAPTIYIRGSLVSFEMTDETPSWSEYTGPISRNWVYIQVKVVGT